MEHDPDLCMICAELECVCEPTECCNMPESPLGLMRKECGWCGHVRDTQPRLLCQRCKSELIPQWIRTREDEGVVSDQYDNNLILEFHGGYGMFTDCIYTCPADKIILCHDCSHKLCEYLDVDPHNWHTHRQGVGQHEDHHDKR